LYQQSLQYKHIYIKMYVSIDSQKVDNCNGKINFGDTYVSLYNMSNRSSASYKSSVKKNEAAKFTISRVTGLLPKLIH